MGKSKSRWECISTFLTAFLVITNPINAQSGSETLEPQYCEAYGDYLQLSADTEVQDCSQLEAFLISIAGLSSEEFLRVFIEEMRPGSVIGTLAQGVSSYRNDDLEAAFSHLDFVDRAFYSAMIDRGDQNRAYIYAVFFSSAKASIFNSHGDQSNSDVIGFMTAEEMLSGSFAFLDTVDPVAVLYCLLRTDALTAQIVDVLLSRPFGLCLVEEGLPPL